MSRRYQDLVEVRLGDPLEHRVRLEPGWCRGAQPPDTLVRVPTQFLWQGRVHLVRGVLAQWSQRVPWWRGAGDGGTTQEGCTMTLPALEQQVWRVEASAGRSHGSGVYDLVSGERWLLERVSD
ncbi:DUF6504 family protein [Ornithinimicrobium pekingense]|uniref:DUF6504 domain-containing protein n=1 Tax=Ornithinimicrobium pekingense TaxID=384677 RepID=A0ABQ2FAE4_9MICO|nr:DUF6504 family protein [Ornithinimicrobium pekingense]GGK69518.1 hypothetical protein GCM10011509_17370 [Ornithinimicrobium pekingense]